MKKYSSYLIVTFLIMTLLGLVISGCGSSSSSLPGDVVNNNPDNPSEPVLNTGGVKVTVNFPQKEVASSEEINANVIPPGTDRFDVRIEGEGLSTDILDYVVPGSFPYTHTINNIPVGYKIMTVRVLDASDNVMAQRKVGFYMYAGNMWTNTLDMGVAIIDENGTVEPSIIEIGAGDTLFFTNWDEVSNRQWNVVLDVPGGGTIAGNQTLFPPQMPDPNQPTSSPYYDDCSIDFTGQPVGDYIYDLNLGVNPQRPGAPVGSMVRLAIAPDLVAIRDDDGAGDNVDLTNGPVNMYYIIEGSEFGVIQETVTFYNEESMTSTFPIIDSWTDIEIRCHFQTTGTSINDGKNLIIVRNSTGFDSNNLVYYYKGSGWYDINIQSN